MANAKIIEVKAAKVEAIKEKFQKAQSVIFFDYRGMTVEEADGLRNTMRAAGVEYIVLKNAIVRRATASIGVDEAILPLLKGPTAFAFGYEDAVAPARILRDTIKKLKKCELKGGLINGVVADQARSQRWPTCPPATSCWQGCWAACSRPSPAGNRAGPRSQVQGRCA